MTQPFESPYTRDDYQLRHDGADYRHGYSHGKDKAHFEVRHHATSGHDWTVCGCEPCITVRYVLESVGVAVP